MATDWWGTDLFRCLRKGTCRHTVEGVIRSLQDSISAYNIVNARGGPLELAWAGSPVWSLEKTLGVHSQQYVANDQP